MKIRIQRKTPTNPPYSIYRCKATAGEEPKLTSGPEESLTTLVGNGAGNFLLHRKSGFANGPSNGSETMSRSKATPSHFVWYMILSTFFFLEVKVQQSVLSKIVSNLT